MRKRRRQTIVGLLFAVVLVLPVGLGLSMASALSAPRPGTSCDVSGTVNFSPALPKASSKTLVKGVFTTNVTLSNCVGGGVTTGTEKSVSHPSNASNCETFVTYTTSPTQATETINWNTGKKSTLALAFHDAKGKLAQSYV